MVDSLVRFSKGDKIGGFGAHREPKQVTSAYHQPNSGHILNPKVIGEKTPKVPNRELPSMSSYSTNGRTLTIKHLKDTIEEVYDSKLRFDQKNFDGRIAR